MKIFTIPLLLLLTGSFICNKQTTNNTDTVPPVVIEICDNDWGENNSLFKTDITITNNSDKAVSFDVNFSIQEDSFLFNEKPPQPLEGPDKKEALNIPVAGYEMAEGSISVSVDPGNTVTFSPVEALKLSTGAYFAGFRVSSPTITKVLYKNYFIMPDELQDKPIDSRFGVNGSNPDLAGLHKKMGLGWVRFENLKWAFISPEKDKFFFDGSVSPWHVEQDRIIKDYTEKYNLNYLPYVFQTPDWATTAPPGHNNSLGFPPVDFNDYGTAIFQIVARYGSKQHPADKLLTDDKVSGMDLLRVIELWNEPNLNAEAWGPWVGPIEDYFEIFRIGAEAAKKADPNILVTSCGWAGIHLEDNIEQMETYLYSDGKTPVNFADILNVHFYSGKADPEISTVDYNVERGADPDPGDKTYEDHLRELVSWWHRVKPGNKPIWLTETGYDVDGPIGLDERYQAAKLPRVAMIAFAAGIDKVFIYRERGSHGTQHAGAGFLRNDNSIRPSWFSYSTLVRQLNGVETGKVPRLIFDDDEKIWGYLWDRGGEKVLAIWSLDDNSVLPLNLGICSVTDSFGKVRQVDINNNLPLGIFPVYISNISDMTGINNLTTIDQMISIEE